MNEAYEKFLAWLSEQHDKAMQCEQEALDCLPKNDLETHRAKMEEKATILSKLALQGEAYLTSLADPLATNLRHTLQRFSSSAQMGLRIGSLFYLSALLYRDDHKVGEPDNLAVEIERMREEGENYEA